MEKSRKRLTLNERVIIEKLLNENKSKSYIASILNRSRSTITREINNWIAKPTDKKDLNNITGIKIV
jgi:IS30 family transposase